MVGRSNYRWQWRGIPVSPGYEGSFVISGMIEAAQVDAEDESRCKGDQRQKSHLFL